MIEKLALVPITFWHQPGVPESRDRIFLVGADGVEEITYDANKFVYVVKLEDKEDEDDDGNPIVIHREIEIPQEQVRLVHKETTEPVT
jgi:hypothetical protein